MFKKLLSALVCMLILTVSLSGCGDAEASVDIGALSDDLLANLSWSEELLEVTSEKVMQNYYFLDDPSAVTSFKLYRSSSGATADEIAVFETKDSDSAALAEAAAKARLDDLSFNFQDYIPAEMPKIENAVLKKSGNCVVLVISGDSAAALDIVDKYMK